MRLFTAGLALTVAVALAGCTSSASTSAADTQVAASAGTVVDCPRLSSFGYNDGQPLQMGAETPGVRFGLKTEPGKPGYMNVLFDFNTPNLKPFGWWVQGEDGTNWIMAQPSDVGRIIPTTGKFWFLILFDDPTACSGGATVGMPGFDPVALKASGQWPSK
jgi:hypothetical protein